LQSLAHAVQLSDHHVDSAHRWFILALQHNFTRGRKSHYIAASCLYLVCRQEKTSHMLLDFSDVLQVNVFELGSVYLKLSRLLNVQLPILDPSLYIGRFAARLEFGDKTQIVANTALRLVSRMKRDWIQIGRRPSGICGACLLIAARIYGFKRTQKEIIHVVRICDMTLRRRLNEFADTPSSQLTPEQFHGIWLEKEADPPAFTRNKLLVQQKSAAESLASDTLSHSLVSVTQTLLPSTTVDTLEAARCYNEVEVEVNLEDMDHDIEVIGALLENHEIDLKTQLWMEANKDFLLAQEGKSI
jgi:transcription factor IIIB 90 kDa subunit